MKHLKIQLSVIIFILLVVSCNDTGKESKKNNEGSFSYLNGLRGAMISGYVADLETGEVIARENENLRMTPASLSKIFTSAAALSELGEKFTFKTGIGIKGKIKGGSLNGDLIIEGGGDPTLGSGYFSSTQPGKVFEKILSILQERGIKTVTDKLVVLSDHFSLPRYPSLRLWEDMSNYYGAPPSGLTFLDNTFTVTLSSPQKIGSLCKVVSVDPACDISFDCRVKSSRSQRDSAYIYGYPGLERWYIDGSIPAGRKKFKIKGALPFPEKVFAMELTQYLNRHGIKINGFDHRTSAGIGNFELIGEVLSPPLSEIIKPLNKKSINLYADHLFLSIAKKYGEADWDNARKVSARFWQKNIGDNDICLYDGSGLSPFNYCTAVDMVKALKYVNNTKLREVFKASLSVSGVDGTLKHIWDSPDTKGRVTGKSGSMKGVLGYAGYIKTRGNRHLAFCIIVNRLDSNFSDVRQLIEQEISEIILNN